MFCYTAYGLTIHSELLLPELVPSEGNADVFIRIDRVEHTPDSTYPSSYHIATTQEVLLFWSDVGTILVRQGHEIVVDPVADVEPEKLRIFILGNALATLLHQRGLLVLHASAVEVEGGAIAFIGDKGWGKSTTSAALHARGYRVVTDDLLVLEVQNTESPVVYPGFPQLKLWPDAVAALGDDPATLKRLYSNIEKRNRQVTDGFSLTPLPLRCIYVLDLGSSHKIELIQGQEIFKELVRHSFLVKFLQSTETAYSHFQQCAKLARCVPVQRLTRQPGLQDLPAIVELIEQHIVHDCDLAKV